MKFVCLKASHPKNCSACKDFATLNSPERHKSTKFWKVRTFPFVFYCNNTATVWNKLRGPAGANWGSIQLWLWRIECWFSTIAQNWLKLKPKSFRTGASRDPQDPPGPLMISSSPGVCTHINIKKDRPVIVIADCSAIRTFELSTVNRRLARLMGKKNINIQKFQPSLRVWGFGVEFEFQVADLCAWCLNLLA